LFGFGMGWGTAGNPGADQDPAELGEHVLEGGLGRGGIPGLGGAAAGDAGRVVAVAGVPDDDQGMHEQGERDGPPDGAADPGAGLAGAEDVAGISEGLLDAPPGRVPLDQGGGGGGQAGGDQGQRGSGVAGQDDPARCGHPGSRTTGR
jgi:hypothetical protein